MAEWPLVNNAPLMPNTNYHADNQNYFELIPLADKIKATQNINPDTIKNPTVDGRLLGDPLSLFLGLESMQYPTGVKALSIDSGFSARHYAPGNPRHIKAFNHLRGKDFSFDYDHFTLPVIIFENATVRNYLNKVGHWILVIYLRAKNEAHYFDPYGGKRTIEPHVKEIIIRAVNTIGPIETKLKPKIIIHSKPNEHNVQTNGIDCGFFCGFIAKQHRQYGLNNMFNPNFIMDQFKPNVIESLKNVMLEVERHTAPLRDTDGDFLEILDSDGNLEVPSKKAKIPETPTFGLSALTIVTPKVEKVSLKSKTFKSEDDEVQIVEKVEPSQATPRRSTRNARIPKVKPVPTVQVNINCKKGYRPKRTVIKSGDEKTDESAKKGSTVEAMEIDKPPLEVLQNVTTVETVEAEKNLEKDLKETLNGEKVITSDSDSTNFGDDERSLASEKIKKQIQPEKVIQNRLNSERPLQLSFKEAKERKDDKHAFFTDPVVRKVKPNLTYPKPKVNDEIKSDASMASDTEPKKSQKGRPPAVVKSPVKGRFQTRSQSVTSEKSNASDTSERSKRGQFQKRSLSLASDKSPPKKPFVNKAESRVISKRKASEIATNEQSEMEIDNTLPVTSDKEEKPRGRFRKVNATSKGIIHTTVAEKDDKTKTKIIISSQVTESQKRIATPNIADIVKDAIGESDLTDKFSNDTNTSATAKNKGGRPKKTKTVRGRPSKTSQELMPPPNFLNVKEVIMNEALKSESDLNPEADSTSNASAESDASSVTEKPKKKGGRPPKRQYGNRHTKKRDSSVESTTEIEKTVKEPVVKPDLTSASTETESDAPSVTEKPKNKGGRPRKQKQGNRTKTEKEVKDPVGDEPRKSERLANQLPKLTAKTDTCHHDDKGHKNKGCASKSVNHQIYYKSVGDFIIPCRYCGVWRNESEINNPAMASKCCGNGTVHTEYMKETHKYLDEKIPQIIKQLVDDAYEENKFFKVNPHAYNATVSFASIQTEHIPPLPPNGPPVVRRSGQISHTGSGFKPPKGANPLYAQPFVIDLSEAEKALNAESLKRTINAKIVAALHTMLRERNPFAQLYKIGAQTLAEATAKALAEGKPLPKFRLTIVDAREEKNFKGLNNTVHPHRAEKPRDEVVGMVWVNDDGEPPEYQGVWLHGTEGETKHVPYWSPNIDPLCYALLFPLGTQIYSNGMKLNKPVNKKPKKARKNIMNDDTDLSEGEVEKNINGSESEGDANETEVLDAEKAGNIESRIRQYISKKQSYRYHLFPRNPKGFKKLHWLWSKGALADAYLIDVVCRVERCDLNIAKQKVEAFKKRFANRNELRKFVEKAYCNGKKLGQLFTIPTSFKGGRKYMQKAYADIMTIIDNTDLPSWFITFTGNPNWPEIQDNLTVKGENRSDIKCRVFMSKAQDFLDDLFKKNVMGKVQAYHVVMEFQKRGMPHLHVILIMKDKITPEDVDDYVSARIPKLPPKTDKSPEAEQITRLHEILMKNNIHLCNQQSACQVDGVCTKGFKKPFCLSTIIHSHKPPEYQRLAPKPEKNNFDAPSPKKDGKVATEKPENSEGVENLEEDFDQEMDYHDELRKDFDVSEVEYKRLPPKPHDIVLTPENEHLFGEVHKKVSKGGVVTYVDDGHIVPYNPYLTLKYNCHINVECTVGQTGSPRYTCKYTTKGGDMVYLKGQKVYLNDKNEECVDFDEGEHHICARIMTGCEAWMRLNNTWIIRQSHTVVTLPLHLEGDNVIFFEEGAEEAAIEKPDKSELLAFFKLCAKDKNARKFTYHQIPLEYRYIKKSGIWQKRKYNPSRFFVRIHHVPPKEQELYALRILLMNVKGPTSFENLKTVFDLKEKKDKIYETFLETAQALNLWENDEIHLDAIKQAFIAIRKTKQKRHFLAMVIAHNRPSNANKFVEQFMDELFALRYEDPILMHDVIKLRALKYLEFIFQKMDTSCRRLGIAVPENFENMQISEEAVKDYAEPEDAPTIDGVQYTFADYVLKRKSTLNPGQLAAFNTVWDTVCAGKGGLFFLEGEGGSGKTWLYNLWIDFCRAEGKKVVSCASTGIAATLLKHGQTAHSAFCIPNDLDNDSQIKIAPQSVKGQILAQCQLIIIDEVSMLHKNVLKYIDKTLKDVCGNSSDFGGVVVVIGGDWKQLTPVVPKANETQIMEASVKKWDRFATFTQLKLTQNMRVNKEELSFVEELKKIGNGEKDIFIEGSDSIKLDDKNVVENAQQLIDFCYPSEWLKNPIKNAKELCGSAILCPKNTVVQKLNNTIITKLPGNLKFFKAVDTPLSNSDRNKVEAFNGDITDKSYEQMKNIETAGMPPNELKLKKGAIVMLIKNISVFTGLCNGTRMQVLDFTEQFLKCKVLTGPRAKSEDEIFIPRCKFEYGGNLNEPGIHFTRCQFPVKLSFGMTINKSQGQTLDRVGLFFRQGECFSHGQMYTGLSRVRTRDSVRILTAFENRNTARNVVWPALLADE